MAVKLEEFVGKLSSDQTSQLLRLCVQNLVDDQVQRILEEEVDEQTRADWAEGWFDPDR